MIKSVIQHALVAGTLAFAAQAEAVVAAGHWTSSTMSGFGNFSVAVDQMIEGDYTGVFMTYANGNLQGVTYTLDEGAKVYVVKPGDVFTQASSALATNVFRDTPIAVGTDFYLAAKTRSYSDPGFTYDESFYTTFGWAHFKVHATGLPQLLESAMAFREPGIIVGTLQAVPEPSSIALMSVGMVALAWRSRKAVSRG